MKAWLKTLLFGVTTGVATAVGSWWWKNYGEKKANELKQQHDIKKNESHK